MEMQNYNIVQAKITCFQKVARIEHLDAQNFAGSLDQSTKYILVGNTP